MKIIKKLIAFLWVITISTLVLGVLSDELGYGFWRIPTIVGVFLATVGAVITAALLTAIAITWLKE